MANAALTRWLAATILALGTLVLIAQEARTPPEQRLAHRELLTRVFEQVVFYWEFGPNREISHVNRWLPSQPIFIFMEGDLRSEYRRFVSDYTIKLSCLTGLAFETIGTLIDDSRASIIRMRFGPRARLKDVLFEQSMLPAHMESVMRDNPACAAIGGATPQGIIRRMFIYANTSESSNGIRSCILEELTQSLGLPNDVDLILPTIFSDLSDPTELTLNDQLLVRTLYDDRLQPGMPRAEAMKIARQVIAELHAAVRARGPDALIHPRHKARVEGNGRQP